ncbi:MAG TPA: hypothetical protein VMO47_14400 [Rhodothermales bacterium]|nr:hypothetical protein [Rhodothermales bacterium]
MNSKSIIAAVAGSITAFVLGYIFYGLLFRGFFAEHTGTAENYMRAMDDLNLLAIFLGELAGAILLTIIFGSWGNIKTFAAGAKAGAIFGLLLALAYGLVLYGTTNAYDLTAVMFDPIIQAVRLAIVGGVIAMLLGRGGSSESGA